MMNQRVSSVTAIGVSTGSGWLPTTVWPTDLGRSSGAHAVLHQVFLTSLTSTKLGQGLALTATPYVPDLDHFRGSYGAKNVMPLYRDQKGGGPNVPDGLLVALSDSLGIEAAAENLLAYAYALGGTSAFHSRFNEALAEAAGPIRIPITADLGLFQQAAELGRDLLWWHTWGERFAPAGQASLPAGQAKAVRPVAGMPESHAYDPESQTLTVGTGAFSPVSEEAWNFEVSGLRVLRSWLGYRMKIRKGKKSSPWTTSAPPAGPRPTSSCSSYPSSSTPPRSPPKPPPS